MKRLLYFLIVMIIIIPLAVACDGDKDGDVFDGNESVVTTENSDTDVTDADETTAEPSETTVKAVEETTEKVEETTEKTEETTKKAEETTKKAEETTKKAEVTTSKPVETGPDIPAKRSSSDIRIVINNIRTYKLTPTAGREMLFEKAVGYYNADILSLQETDEGWTDNYGLVTLLARQGYCQVPINGTGAWAGLVDKNDRNAIFYKTSTMRLIKSGYDRYQCVEDLGIADDRPDVAYTWAQFEEKATGKTFVVVSTHFISTGAGGYTKGQLHLSSANELLGVVKNLESTLNCPVIITGDFNSGVSSEVYGKMTEDFYSARDNATVKINMDYNTTNAIGSAPAKGGSAIDHCFYSKTGVNAKQYATIVDEVSYAYSDHVPSCFDFKLT